MGTWYTISAVNLSEPATELFIREFGENSLGKSYRYATCGKDGAPQLALSDFASGIINIADLLSGIPAEATGELPIWVSFLCEESGSPMLLTVAPKEIVILYAGNDFVRSYFQKERMVVSDLEQEARDLRQRIDKSEELKAIYPVIDEVKAVIPPLVELADNLCDEEEEAAEIQIQHLCAGILVQSELGNDGALVEFADTIKKALMRLHSALWWRRQV